MSLEDSYYDKAPLSAEPVKLSKEQCRADLENLEKLENEISDLERKMEADPILNERKRDLLSSIKRALRLWVGSVTGDSPLTGREIYLHGLHTIWEEIYELTALLDKSDEEKLNFLPIIDRREASISEELERFDSGPDGGEWEDPSDEW